MAFLFQTKNLLLAREFPTALDMECGVARCIRYWSSVQANSAWPFIGAFELQALTREARLSMARICRANGSWGPTVKIHAWENGLI